jgi:ATP/maltotriose-dependent transcriptional regulator MalT
MSSDLLKTKLFIPPARIGLVSRHRLLQKLEDGLQHGQRLTLVSAPPGFGKTTLITAWQKEQSGDQKKHRVHHCLRRTLEECQRPHRNEP